MGAAYKVTGLWAEFNSGRGNFCCVGFLVLTHRCRPVTSTGFWERFAVITVASVRRTL